MDKSKTTEITDQQEWEQRAFTGDAPFNDGDTPERAAFREKRMTEYQELQQRKLDKKRKREELLASQPLRKLEWGISRYAFVNPITPDEREKTKLLSGALGVKQDSGGEWVDLGKEARRGFGGAFGTHWRAQFYAQGMMRVLCVRRMAQTADVARIADLARHIFWQYRKPGCFNIEMTDDFCNFSMQRVRADFECEPELVTMLQGYRDELLKQGVFSEDPAALLSAHTKRAYVSKFKSADLEKRITALEKAAPSELAPTPNEETIRQVVDVAMRAHGENAHQLNTIVSEHSFEIGTLKGKLESHVSHFATAHPVTINAMNKLQNDHVTFVSTALSAIDALNQRLLTLSEIVMRQSQHIEKLEARPTLEAVFEPTCAIGEGGTQ